MQVLKKKTNKCKNLELKMMNKLKRKILLSIFLMILSGFTQLGAEDDSEEFSYAEKCFTIVESGQKHELNPHYYEFA